MRFPSFKHDILYALDLDGVLIDSIEECYSNCIITLYGKDSNRQEEKKLFYKYRGYVQPAYEFYFLMISIKENLNNNQINVLDHFTELKNNGPTKEAKQFETQFFASRRQIQKENFDAWISLNPLSEFGRYIKNNHPDNMIIITTKNKDSARAILTYHHIHPQNIYGNNEVRSAGSKGNLLNKILDRSSLDKIFFIDDSIEHLDTVNNDDICCYFANWGYGVNNGYKVYCI